MKLSFHRIFAICFFLSSLTLGQPLTPVEANTRVETLSRTLGQPFGAVLDSPEAVFVVAGLRPEYTVSVDGVSARADLTEAAFSALGSRDLEVVVSDGEMRLRSASALRAATSKSKLPGILVFEGDTHDWEGWRKAQTERLNESSPELGSDIVDYLVSGAPDGVIQTYLVLSEDILAQQRALDVVIPYASDFIKPSGYFELLPELLTPEYREWRDGLAAFSSEYFSLISVRERFRSADWQKARRQVFPNASDRSPGENYYQGTLYEFANIPQGRTTEHELLFSDHAEAWALAIRKGDTPSDWVRAFVRWAGEVGFTRPLGEDDLMDWIWEAAFALTSAQRTVFQAVAQTYPDYYPSLSQTKLESWLEDEETVESRATGGYYSLGTAGLFRHPAVKQFYLQAPAELRTRVAHRLKAYKQADEVRPIIEAAPYSL